MERERMSKQTKEQQDDVVDDDNDDDGTMLQNWIFVNNIFPAYGKIHIEYGNQRATAANNVFFEFEERVSNWWACTRACLLLVLYVCLCMVLSLRFSFSTIFHIYWQDEFLYSIENNNLLATSIRHSRALLPFLQMAFVMLLLLLLFTAIIAVVGAAVISRLWNHICLWVIELNKKVWVVFFSPHSLFARFVAIHFE